MLRGLLIAQKSRIVLSVYGCLLAILFGCSTKTIIENKCGAAIPQPAQSLNVDGVSVNFQASLKSNQSRTIVLIHGFGGSLETWHDIYPGLSAEFSIVRLDLRGSGFTSKPEDRKYSPGDQAEFLTHFLERLGLRHVVLVGHSLGGEIALVTYLKLKDHPQTLTIDGLALLDSAGYVQKQPAFVTATKNPISHFFMSYSIPPPLRAKLMLEALFAVDERVTPDRICRYAYFMDMRDTRHPMEQTAKLIEPPDAKSNEMRFKDIDVPTLIIWGAEDPGLPVENAHRFHSDIRRSKLVILEKTGHVPQEERPQEVLQQLKTFMSELR
jgi:pimeloyl-ACP methyl ester carboxylesterase